jgi:hypothetical protein
MTIKITDFIEAIEIELEGGISAKEATAAWTQLQALTRKAHGIMREAQSQNPAYDSTDSASGDE